MILAIADVRAVPEAQPRVSIDMDVVAAYAEELKSGAEFPPVVVFYDGTAYWLGDGWHRLAAYQAIGATRIPVDRRTGGRRDAILYACGANAAHGLPRTNTDKRRAVETLLGDSEWAKKSDRWIAEKACVSDPFVGKIRAQLQTVSSSEPREGRDGKTRKSRSSPPAAKKTPEPKSEREPAALDFEDAPEHTAEREEPRAEHKSEPPPAAAKPPTATPPRPAQPETPAKYSNMAVRDGAAKVLKDVRVVWGFMRKADRELFRQELLAAMESE